jgi:uncharacterized protein
MPAGSAIVLVVVLLVAFKLFVWYLEPRLVFYPFAGVQATPRSMGIAYRDLTLTTRDGVRLAAWWIDHDAARIEVVYFHGNGGNLSNWLPILADIQARGCAILAIDYRGYGASGGASSEQGLYRDADAALAAFWRDLHRPDRRVVYWGRSLGTTVAAYAAQVRPPDGLVLESPFPDKASVIADSPVFRLLNLFSSYRFPTRAFLRGYAGPALVVAGEGDTTIPLRLSRRVFDSIAGPKTFLEVPYADHNDLHLVEPRVYWRGIEAFLGSLTVAGDAASARR